MYRDPECANVRLLSGLRVHYSSLRYRRATAIDFAKQQGRQLKAIETLTCDVIV